MGQFKHVIQCLALLSIVSTVVKPAFAQDACANVFLKTNTDLNRHEIGGNFPPVSMDEVLKEEVRGQRQNSGEYHIRSGGFAQIRSFQDIRYRQFGDQTNAFDTALTKLPPGAVVLDLGAGFGLTIATALYPERVPYANTSFGETRETWIAASGIAKNLRFLGVTASEETHLATPTIDPKERYKIKAGRLFQDIPDTELLAAFGQRVSAAWDMYGVLAYTARPDLDLAKLTKIVEPGSKIFVFYASGTVLSSFQKADGSMIDFKSYIKDYFGSAFEITEHHQFIELTLKDKPTYRDHSVEMVGSDDGIPPTRTFRILEADRSQLTHEQELANEKILWKKTGTATNSFYEKKFAPWLKRDPRAGTGNSRGVPVGPQEALDAINNKFLKYESGAFHPSTIEALDPFWVYKKFSILTRNENWKAAKQMVHQHLQTFSSDSVLFDLLQALDDIHEGRMDSPRIQKLSKNPLPKLERDFHSGADSTEQRSEQFSLDAFVGTMIFDRSHEQAYSGLGPRPEDRAKTKTVFKGLNRLSNLTPEQSESRYQALLALRSAFLDEPRAIGWLDQLPLRKH